MSTIKHASQKVILSLTAGKSVEKLVVHPIGRLKNFSPVSTSRSQVIGKIFLIPEFENNRQHYMIATKVSLSTIILFALVMPEGEEQITVNLLS